MADATLVTEVVVAAGAAISALTPIVMSRLKTRREQDATVLDSFTRLNQAQAAEIERLRNDMSRLQTDYERRLNAAQDRITQLEAEVATLNRLLSKRDTG